MNKFKKFIALALTLAMTLSIAVTAASAYSNDTYSTYAPDEIMEVNNSILSGATAAANTTALSFLGINVTSTDVPGVLNAYSDVDNPINLLVFGSEANTNPDPYLWNFYYNFNKDGGTYPADPYDMDAYADWEGAYTLLNYAKQGPTGAAPNTRTIDIDVNGTPETCNPLFFYEPDVLFGGNNDDTGTYSVGLEYYQSKVNSAYNPLVLYGWTRSDDGYARDDGTFASTAAMANGVYSMAKEIQDYIDNEGDGDEDEDTNVDTEENEDQDEPGEETKKGSRYNDGSVLQCGIDYSNFALGVYYYVQSRLQPNNSLVGQIAEAGYCTGISITSGGVVTITNDNDSKMPNRYLQYMDGIAHEADTYEDSGKTYSSYGDLKKDVDLLIMDTSLLTDSQKFMINHVNIKIVDINSIMPQTVYGTTMQSADNILGVPYFVGLLYEGRLSNNKESLSEYDYTAYFINDLYHVNDADVETVLKTMIGDGCGDAYNGYKGLTSGYETYINQMIRIGAVYYEQTSMGSGNWLAIDNGDFYVDYGA